MNGGGGDGGGGAKASARSPTCTSPLACRLATAERVVRRAETATPTIPRKRSTQKTSSAKKVEWAAEYATYDDAPTSADRRSKK